MRVTEQQFVLAQPKTGGVPIVKGEGTSTPVPPNGGTANEALEAVVAM